MKYKLFDYQCQRYMGDYNDEGVIFDTKKQAIDYLISYFSIDNSRVLTFIRETLWRTGEYAEIKIKPLSECE